MKNHLSFALALLTLFCTSAHAQLPSYLPADGLVGWWPFNGNANDESGNGNDGVVVGASITSDRHGSLNGAYDFNGVDNFINVASNNQLLLNGNEFTISAWVTHSGINDIDKNIVVKSNGIQNQPKWIFWYKASINSPSGLGFASNQVMLGGSSNPVLLNNWYHYLVKKTSDSLSLYINGNVSFSGSFQFTNSNTTADMRFGGQELSGGGQWWLGKLDDIAIYNRALTEQEIQNLYTATNTGNTVDTGNGAAPLPQGIPYQAVARDDNGQPVADSPVNVRFSLREGAADGAASYIESHSLTTNSIGLFNTVFGNGTPEQSAFDSINWAATTKFLQVEVDLGNGYVDMGTTQLLSVPYAFRAAQAANIKNAALPVYPDNAAALAGGLVAGEMYRTATGDLKVVY
jgi:hypothetical protein